MQVRRRFFQQSGDTCGTARCFKSKRRPHGQAAFINKEKQPHDLCSQQYPHKKKEQLSAQTEEKPPDHDAVTTSHARL